MRRIVEGAMKAAGRLSGTSKTGTDSVCQPKFLDMKHYESE